MPFSDPIVADDVLVRESIQSGNYETGVSGWSINRDGTAEFSDITVRGSLRTAATGKRIELGPDYFAGGDPVILFSDSVDGSVDFDQPQVQARSFSAGRGLVVLSERVDPSSGGSVFVRPDGITLSWEDIPAGGHTLVEIDEAGLSVTGTSILRVVQIATEGPTAVSAFLNGWSNFGASGYADVTYEKEPTGYVTVSGLVKGGTIADASSGNVFVLPAGYRPAGRLVFPSVANNGFGRVDVTAAGEVRVVAGASNAFVTLSGVRFKAVA